ncbi:hypothetical protein AGABI2DRAFT_136941 [Agaricus bisporus var. bisporus H97]|uniref:hypothetical protein n=1 Tax=Agaricus bisporus var. bisporus (strain H97 / ATCC MYA-4626 / FGSC 10389) TaxID=936046 RepID=UPI00029F719F|nr:hypothetical protein AGABI2DRAFT_136941 [Agaricus bisporus var. bisporus H97]EKV46784.1 hypothetical protein AGABI2DRAFT_136941 [Agaricus bisporus var. bisporus H97]
MIKKQRNYAYATHSRKRLYSVCLISWWRRQERVPLGKIKMLVARHPELQHLV